MNNYRCEGLPTGPCPESRCDSTVKLGLGDLMLCSKCDSTRRDQERLQQQNVVQTTDTVREEVPKQNSVKDAQKHSKGESTRMAPPVKPAAPTKPMLVNCEVLYFMQNKSALLPFDSIVTICADFYTCSELEEARSLLTELLPQSKRLPRHTGSDDSKRRKIANDLLKVCLDPNLQLTTFCSTDIRRIPPVGLEHVDVCSLLQEVSALRAEVRSFVSLRAEISDIRKDLADVHASSQAVVTCTSASVSMPSSAGIQPAPATDDRAPSQAVTETMGTSASVNAPTAVSQTTPTAAQVLSASVQSGAIQQTSVMTKRKPITVVGKATNKKLKVVATRRRMNVFVTRLSPDTSENDVISCAAETVAEEICGTRLSDVTGSIHCEKLVTKHQSYSSFWLSCVVESDVYDKVVALLMSEEAWPSGVLVRKFYPKRNG